MPHFKIISGDFKPDTIYEVFGNIVLKETSGKDRIYVFKRCFASITKITENKKKVIFEAELKDGKKFRAETSTKDFNAILYTHEKHKGDKGVFELTPPVAETQPKPQPRPKKTKKSSSIGTKIVKGLLWTIIIFVSLLLLLVWPDKHNGGLGHDPSPRKIEKARAKAEKEKQKDVMMNQGMVKYHCHELVKERLRSPKSADFPWGEEVIYNNKDLYTIRSYVDAQNGFGANIRSYYKCQMQLYVNDKGEEVFKLTELSMN